MHAREVYTGEYGEIIGTSLFWRNEFILAKCNAYTCARAERGFAQGISHILGSGLGKPRLRCPQGAQLRQLFVPSSWLAGTQGALLAARWA